MYLWSLLLINEIDFYQRPCSPKWSDLKGSLDLIWTTLAITEKTEQDLGAS